MAKGTNRKKKAGEWSKYTLARVTEILMNETSLDIAQKSAEYLQETCEHDWQSGSLADGWQKCTRCDAVRRYVAKKEA